MTKTKTKKILLIAGIAALIACVALVLLVGAGESKPEPDLPVKGENLEYTVQITNAAGIPMEDVGVYIYEDETLEELVWFDQTDAQGLMTFTAPQMDTYVAVLSDVPAGYAVEDTYPLTGQVTQITLQVGNLEDANPEELRYKLGDLMMDFTVTDTDGVSHTLSELLKEKKAVVLNFWYLECNPCKAEFPFLQQAYELYRQDVEVLALNPVNTDEAAIAAFKAENGLAFPMAMVDESWAQILQLTAYPTTVVIDRYGMISLYHVGGIDDADTFEQMFEYFISDDYDQTPVESLNQIVVEDEGSEENPMQTSGGQSFEVEVEADSVYHFELYKITGPTYLTVYGEDFTLTYGGKSYASSNGSVSVTITSDGPSAPVKLSIENHTDKKQTCKIYLTAPKGSQSNPYSISLGEFTISTPAGSEQGVFGTYTAEESGTLTVRCLSSSVREYGFYLYNLRSYAMRNADEDGNVDENGYVTVSVQVKKGDPIQFSVAVARDENNVISAGSFRFELKLAEGDGEEAKKAEPPKQTYTVKVTDEDGDPVEGVSVSFKGEFTYEPTEDDPEDLKETEVKVDLNLTTDKKGKVTTEQVVGDYTATVRVPEGYTLEKTQYKLTAEKTKVTVKLQKIQYHDYKVTVLYPNGDPVKNVGVMVGSEFQYTNKKGAATFHLKEGQYTASLVGIPAGYILENNATAVSFPEGKTSVKIRLVALGTAENPYHAEQFPYTAPKLAAGESVYIRFCYESTPVLTVENKYAAITMDGTEYLADGEGVVAVPLAQSQEAVTVKLTNTAQKAKTFTLTLAYPEGSQWNPKQIEDLSLTQVELAEGDADGCYYSYTPDSAGALTLRVESAEPADALYEVTVTTAADGTVPVTGADVTVQAKAKETVVIFARALPVEVPVEVPGEDTDPEVTDPEESDPEVTDPEESDPEVTDPEVTDPEESDPEVTDPEVTDPEVTDPENTDPEVTDPENTDPEEPVETVTVIPAIKLTLVGSFESAGAPEEEEPDAGDGYTVTVQDYSGKAISGVAVQILKNGAVAQVGVTDGSGLFAASLEDGSYEVKLAFAQSGYHYEERTAVLTPDAPHLTVLVTDRVPAPGVEDHWKLGTAYAVETGGTYLTIQKDILTYYLFTPTEEGTYSFTTSDPAAVISYWGGENFPSNQTANTDYKDNRFTLSINQSYLGQSYVLGVIGAEDCILEIIREGSSAFNPDEVPYTAYELQEKPKQFTLTETGTQTYVKLSGKTADYTPVLGEDGYYHMGSEDGPILYVHLKGSAPYIALYSMCGGGGAATGAPFRYNDYSDLDNLIKEDYTQCILDYGDCVDKKTGVYPLTEDLIHILQYGVKNMGWADPDSPNFLFTDVSKYNPELGWMFACCYFK